MTPPVDVVIAVHTTRRPIGRAVASVLDGNGDTTRLTVVCHNVPVDQIAAVVAPEHRARVRFLEHRDNVRSPAGPFNAGMRAADADFVSIMGSDDMLEAGAVHSWLQLAERTGAETVISRLVIGHRRRPVPTPPVRPLLRGPAHPVKDRLSYRSAPLGLVSTEARRRLGLELVEEIVVGDDVPYVTRLWFETRVAVDRHGPAYVIGEDAEDRVTYERRPVIVELEFVRHLLAQRWFRDYGLRERRAICTKLARIHLFGAIYHRQDATFWDAENRTALATVTDELLLAAPGFERPLSLADRALLDAARTPQVHADKLTELARKRRKHGRPATVVTRSPLHLLHREAPIRMMTSSILVR
ncbi:glycosyltransferase [Georgenia phoenicis]|uniref:glycosyltransferase family 2 protein n=1 Tax=unclassified Georgenia TaxID=2626815 RepID=UPI0039B05DDC